MNMMITGGNHVNATAETFEEENRLLQIHTEYLSKNLVGTTERSMKKPDSP